MSTVPQLNSALDFGNCCVSTWSAPADGLRGGDWLESYRLKSGLIGISIGDVEGHGSSVAAHVNPVRDAIVRSSEERVAPAAVLSLANEEAVAAGKLVTSIYARLDPRARIMTFANAGHPAPLLVTAADSRYLEPVRANLPLGVFTGYYATEQTLGVPEEALLVFYTDGVTERERDPIRGAKDLADTARRAFADVRADAARAIAEGVFRSGRGHDDAAILAIRFRSLSRRRGLTTLPTGALASLARGSSVGRRATEHRTKTN